MDGAFVGAVVVGSAVGESVGRNAGVIVVGLELGEDVVGSVGGLASAISNKTMSNTTGRSRLVTHLRLSNILYVQSVHCFEKHKSETQVDTLS